MVLSVFIASIVLFLLLRLLPGDPANALVSVGADAAQIEAARKQVGSDLPLYEQFLRFIGSLLRFDLGNSFVSGAPVLAEIGKRLIVTVPLTLMAFVVAIMIAVPLGILSVVRQNRWYGTVISVISQLGIAVPVFWIGILLVWFLQLSCGCFLRVGSHHEDGSRRRLLFNRWYCRSQPLPSSCRHR